MSLEKKSFGLYGGNFFLFLFSGHMLMVNFTTGPQSFTEGLAIKSIRRLPNIFCSELLCPVLKSFIAVSAFSGHAFLNGSVKVTMVV